VCAFTVANSERYKDKQGNERENTIFIDVEAWNKTGEIIAKQFAKGDPIIVWGRLMMDESEDKNTGQRRTKIKLRLVFPTGCFDFCGKSSRQGSNQAGGGQSSPPQQ